MKTNCLYPECRCQNFGLGLTHPASCRWCRHTYEWHENIKGKDILYTFLLFVALGAALFSGLFVFQGCVTAKSAERKALMSYETGHQLGQIKGMLDCSSIFLGVKDKGTKEKK